jgi:chromosome segregation ATPase
MTTSLRSEIGNCRAQIQTRDRDIQRVAQDYEAKIKTILLEHHESSSTVSTMHKKEVDVLKRKLDNFEADNQRLVGELSRVRASLDTKAKEHIENIRQLRSRVTSLESELENRKQQIIELENKQRAAARAQPAASKADLAIKESEWALEKQKLLFDLEQAQARYSEILITGVQDNQNVVQTLEAEKQELTEQLSKVKEEFHVRLSDMRTRFELMSEELRREKQEIQTRHMQAEQGWNQEKHILTGDVTKLRNKLETVLSTKSLDAETVPKMRDRLQDAEKTAQRLEEELRGREVERTELKERIRILDAQVQDLEKEAVRREHQRRELVNLHIDKEAVWNQERRSLMDDIISLKNAIASGEGSNALALRSVDEETLAERPSSPTARSPSPSKRNGGVIPGSATDKMIQRLRTEKAVCYSFVFCLFVAWEQCEFLIFVTCYIRSSPHC